MKTPLVRSFTLSAIMASAILFSTRSAQAATFTYNANVSGNWSTDAVWSGGTAPASSLDNVISITHTAGADTTATHDLGSGFLLNSLSLQNDTTSKLTVDPNGSSINFVKDSSNVLPTLLLTRNNSGGIVLSTPFTVTDALTITNSGTGSGTTQISGLITNNGGITFDGTNPNGFSVISTSIVSGSGGLLMNGSYTLNLSSKSTYTGVTEVRSGTLNLQTNTNNIANSSAVLVSGGTLNLTTSNLINGEVTLSSGTISGGATLTSNTSFSLTNTGTISVKIAGSGALTKTGAGTATLSGANTYTGATSVTQGTLSLGSASALGNTASVTINGGMLASSVANVNLGTNASLLMSSGSIDINGAGTAGTFTLASNKNFTATGGTLNFDIGGSFDQIIGSGTGSFSLTDTTLALSGLTSVAGTYQLFTGFGGTNSVTRLTITGLAGGYTGILDTTGLLTVSAIPEPSTYAAMLGASALGFVAFRRRTVRR
jgi:autotransporter-associated beta strand protein